VAMRCVPPITARRSGEPRQAPDGCPITGGARPALCCRGRAATIASRGLARGDAVAARRARGLAETLEQS
jgi:hypothetical protein